MKRILFVEQMQFGYSTNTIEFVKRLRGRYDITVYCCDFGRNKISIDGVNVVYVTPSRSGILNAINFRLGIGKLKLAKYDYVFITYFVGMSLVHLLSRRTVKICNVRTSAIFYSRLRRLVYNGLIFADVLTFKHRAIVSHGLASFFRIKKYHYLPVGANLNHFGRRSFDEINLIYVGVFDNRNIEDTVMGFDIFRRKFGNRIKCTYTIVGGGTEKARQLILDTISDRDLSHLVSLIGYVQRDKLGEYLSKANVGVSYVPIKSYYNYQPPTKTFEYLMSGLPVIATATYENCQVISDLNGVVIKDKPEAFSDGLERLMVNKSKFDSEAIQSAAEVYSWDRIVNQNLCNYLNSL